MSNDMPADWLPPICTSEQRRSTRITLHLVRHESHQVELFSHLGQLAEELTELLLTLAELTTADVVDAEEGHQAVDDEEAVLAGGELLGEVGEAFGLALAVGNTALDDVFVGCLGLDAEALGDLDDALGAEGAFCVYT